MRTQVQARANREAKLDALQGQLSDAVSALVTGEDWKRALTFAAQFRSRSFNNTMLIYAQHLGGVMPTLLSEHSITDFDTWHDAFMRFAARREEGGVLRERLMQPVDDPHDVLIDLEFATLEAARRVQEFLEMRVWSTPAHSPALVCSPGARIAEAAPVALS